MTTILQPSIPAPANSPSEAPLPSWNEGPAKQRIVNFVREVTTVGDPHFVRPRERIAVFDNDGTLWCEQPFYFQFAFVLDRMKAMAPQHPEWKDNPFYSAVLAGDMKALAAGGVKGVLELATITHAGMTTDEFEKLAAEWIETAKHPKFNRLYTDVIYQPMIEVLEYLRAHDFKTFIVSGGGADFMRVWAEKVYGIPPEQVIGSSIVTRFEIVDGVPVLTRMPELNFMDDNVGKPVAIHAHIGRRPIAAFGNSDGDLQMLQWTTGNKGPSLALLVHHTDPIREFAYDASSMGKLEVALTEAAAQGWTVVDMKNDWNRVFAFEELTSHA
jgi:phosphoserine phosphatase